MREQTPSPVDAKKIAQPGKKQIATKSPRVSSSAAKKAAPAKTTQAVKPAVPVKKTGERRINDSPVRKKSSGIGKSRPKSGAVRASKRSPASSDRLVRKKDTAGKRDSGMKMSRASEPPQQAADPAGEARSVPLKSGGKRLSGRKPSGRRARQKTFPQIPLPDKRQKTFPLPSRHELPREYGEDDLLTVVVDPDVVFADWEIRPGHFVGRYGDLYLRVYDMTAGGNGSSGSYFDIRILSRIGSGFFRVDLPGREVVLAIGLMAAKGRFRAIIRSRRLLFPPYFISGERDAAGTPSEPDRPVGY